MNDPIDDDEHNIDNSSNSVTTTAYHSANNSDDEYDDDDVWFQPAIFDDYEQAKQNYYDTIQKQQRQQQNTSHINKNTNMKNNIINIQDHRGMTALHHSIHEGVNGSTAFIQNFLLSNKNIDITIRDNEGDTPLHTAIQFGNYEIVKLLLEYEEEKRNGHLNDTNENDDDVAAINTIISDDNHHHIDEDVEDVKDMKDEEVIMSMIYIRNNLGETPLHNAVGYRSIEIIKLLLSYDAKYQKIICTYNNNYNYLNIPDNNGISPIQLIHQHKK